MKKLFLNLTLGISAIWSSFAGAPATDLHVRLDPSDARPIHPFIYGQFVEHMGRCIYGGIWAEMLEDRKFCFPVTPDYNPYGNQVLSDPDFPGVIDATEFPVVSASPWEIVGDVSGLEMVTQDRFVGQHTPKIRAGTGVRQNDLGVREGMNYPGYIWAKPLNGPSEVEVRLVMGNGQDAPSLSKRIRLSDPGYSKQSFEFVSSKTIQMGASLEIKVIEGEILLGTVSIMPGDNINGMRRDTIELLRQLDAPIYRWPGGNFVSGYNWRDGIGDRDRRPPRRNPAWTGVEHNDFGTDEFIAFCRLIGAEPLIAANTGFGDSYSAAQWVEYTNGDASSTIGGGWRAANGSQEPYGVKYWCVGNEMWGNWQLGHMQLHHYVLKHNEFADAMRSADPGLVLIASGDLERVNHDTDPVQSKSGMPWTEGMLRNSAKHMDFISEHFYVGRTPWSETGRVPVSEHMESMRNAIRVKAEGHRALQPRLDHLGGRFIPIAMTEWNYWHREYRYGELGCIYDLADGLGVAAGLHEFYRHTDLIEMALYAQTVNVIGAIKTTRIAAELETTGLALSMYRRHFGTRPVSVQGDFGSVDVSAALTRNKDALTIAVINPGDSEVRVRPDLAAFRIVGDASRWHFGGPDALAHNLPGKERAVDMVHTGGLSVADGLVVPGLSAAIFMLPLSQE